MTAEGKKPTRDHHVSESGTHEALGVPSYSYLSRLVAAFEDFNAEIRLLRYAETEVREAIESLEAQLTNAWQDTIAAREEAAAARRESATAQEAIAVARRELAAAQEEAARARQKAVVAEDETARARQEAAVAKQKSLAVFQEVVAARTEGAALQGTLQALYSSTSWRITGPMRRVMRLLRRETEARTPVGTTSAFRIGADAASFHDESYEAATRLIMERYLPPSSGSRPAPLHVLLGSEAIVRRRFSTLLPRRDISPSAATPTYSIVTPYFAHEGEFRFCAESIAALFAADNGSDGQSRIEWIVVNDDPACSEDWLRAVIPDSLAAHTRILSDGLNHGIAESLNRGIRAAKHEWIALLDCDDMIEPHALSVLDKEIKGRPNCRYFSSCIIDIDEDGRELRRRRHEYRPEALFEAGMVMGHLKVFRRDLFDELGGFDARFTGVQDYDFALRAGASEELHQIPDHLYRYRWHHGSQSVARAARQDRLADAARASFLRKLLVGEAVRPLTSDPLPEQVRGFCAIRTQGTRMELLEAAIASVQSQSIPMTACVAVHGPAATRHFVEQRLRRRGFFDHSATPIVVAASAPSRRRGYPCNVALDVLYARPDDFDVFCFLDDDDHFLPNFTSTLLDHIRLSQADMAFGLTNALATTGEPMIQHSLLPAVTLFRRNFMPINSYLCRTPALLATKARFDEELDYLEDWDFLVQLMAAGIKAVPAFATVSEYRLMGDGNASEKRDPDHFKYCLATVGARGARAASGFSRSRFWNDVLDFPSDRTLPFSDQDIAGLKAILDFTQDGQ